MDMAATYCTVQWSAIKAPPPNWEQLHRPYCLPTVFVLSVYTPGCLCVTLFPVIVRNAKASSSSLLWCGDMKGPTVENSSHGSCEGRTSLRIHWCYTN